MARLFWLVRPRAPPFRRTLNPTLLALTLRDLLLALTLLALTLLALTLLALTLLALTLTLTRWAPRLTSTTMSSAARDRAPRTPEAARTPTPAAIALTLTQPQT